MSVDETASTAFCTSCGARNTSGNRFCGECGARLSVTATSDPEAAPVVAIPLSVETDVIAASQKTQETVITPTILAPVPEPAMQARAAVVKLTLAEEMALERERNRLLTLVNVQRMRGQIDEARATVTQTIALSEGRPGREIAPVYELLGDLYADEERWDDARQAYGKAHELDQSRAGAEKKFALMTLRIAEAKDDAALASAMLRGESLTDLLTSGANDRKRNAGMAMFLSLVPGFGQFYNGEFVKGAILLGAWALCLMIFVLSPQQSEFFRAFIRTVALKPGGNFPPFLSFIGVVSIAVWLYSIVDAPFMASKGPQARNAGPKIDKTGWEV